MQTKICDTLYFVQLKPINIHSKLEILFIQICLRGF